MNCNFKILLTVNFVTEENEQGNVLNSPRTFIHECKFVTEASGI
jgi:hypothetical protein